MPRRRPFAPPVVLLAAMGVAAASVATPALAQDKPAPPANAAPADAAKAKAGAKPSADEAALRDVLRALAKALQDGDAEGIRRVIHAANPTERKMVDSMAAMAGQIARLYKAAAKAFGEDQAKSLTGDVAAELSRIDQAEVTIDRDTATVRYAQPAAPDPKKDGSAAAPAPPPPSPDKKPDDPPAPAPASLVLKRFDGRWQVPVAELSKDTTPEEIEQRLADLDVQTKVIAELVGEVTAGKHKNAEKAAEAWQAKMMQALTPRKPAAGTAEGEKASKAEGEKGQTGKSDTAGSGTTK